jgi:hypothetical protein
VWAETPHVERPAFKVYKFRKGAWPEMILHAVMGAARHMEDARSRIDAQEGSAQPRPRKGNGLDMATSAHVPGAGWNGNGVGAADAAAYGPYAKHVAAANAGTDADPLAAHNGHAAQPSNGVGDRISGWFKRARQ